MYPGKKMEDRRWNQARGFKPAAGSTRKDCTRNQRSIGWRALQPHHCNRITAAVTPVTRIWDTDPFPNMSCGPTENPSTQIMSRILVDPE